MKGIPFRNNPEIKTNWFNTKTKRFSHNTVKRAYYDISAKKKGLIKIKFREEKNTKGLEPKTRHWTGNLQFEIDSQFAKDLKMFLKEYISE